MLSRHVVVGMSTGSNAGGQRFVPTWRMTFRPRELCRRAGMESYVGSIVPASCPCCVVYGDFGISGLFFGGCTPDTPKVRSHFYSDPRSMQQAFLSTLCSSNVNFRGVGMVDTRHPLCREEKCTRQPSFGTEVRRDPSEAPKMRAYILHVLYGTKSCPRVFLSAPCEVREVTHAARTLWRTKPGH